jgi:hypothetical protein
VAFRGVCSAASGEDPAGGSADPEDSADPEGDGTEGDDAEGDGAGNSGAEDAASDEPEGECATEREDAGAGEDGSGEDEGSAAGEVSEEREGGVQPRSSRPSAESRRASIVASSYLDLRRSRQEHVQATSLSGALTWTNDTHLAMAARGVLQSRGAAKANCVPR